MLRSPLATLKGRPAAGLKWTAAALLMLTAAGVAGLRPPASVAEEPEVYDVVDLNKSEPIPLTLAPAETTAAISVSPGSFMSAPQFAPIAAIVDELAPLKTMGLSAKDICELLIAVPPPGSQKPRFVVRFYDAKVCDAVLAKLEQSPGMNQVSEGERPVWRDASEQVTRYDATTLVVDHYATTENGQAPPLIGQPPDWADEWDRPSSLLSVWLDNRKLFEGRLGDDLRSNPQLALIAPIIEKIDHLSGAVTADDNARVSLIAFTDDDEGAKQVASTLSALVVLGRNGLNQHRENAPAEHRDAYLAATNVLASFMDGLQITTDGAGVQLVYQPNESVAEIGELAQTLLPAITAARSAARRTQSTNNLKQLALAMLNYEITHGHYPAALNYDYVDPETNEKRRSEHPHSWRVAILPFLEQQALYNAYHFDEPWDSEANMEIANTIVPVMADPSDPASANAGYFVPVGAQTMFPGEQAVKIREVTDGTSRTILIVEAKRDIPWTKPEDIEIPEDGPLPEFGGHYPNIFLRALADGSVRDTPIDTDPELLRAMLTRNGAEVFNW